MATTSLGDAVAESTSVVVGGITVQVAQAGPADGAPVLLLHGFPESAYGWRRQIEPLASAGFRLLIPDLRGYAGSDKPEGLDAYSLETLAVDVLALIDSTGHDRAALIGHDWGGIVAWWTAIRHPDRVERLAVLNAPHPIAFRHYLRTRPSQWLKSWYAFVFQIPGLPERLLRRRDFRMLERALVGTSLPGTFTTADLDRYRLDWSRPGALRAMVHWYRAAFRRRPSAPADSRVGAPTLILWGPGDRFLEPALARKSLDYCRSGRLEWIEGATHWLQHEQPDRVNRLLIDFLRDGSPTTI